MGLLIEFDGRVSLLFLRLLASLLNISLLFSGDPGCICGVREWARNS